MKNKDYKQEILNLIEQLKFNLNEDEVQYILNQFASFNSNLDVIENIDLNKYKKYNIPVYNYSVLREDTLDTKDSDPKSHLRNCVCLEKDYVVVNNVKR